MTNDQVGDDAAEDREIYEADRDIYRIHGSFNTNITFRETNEELLNALGNSRKLFEPLREAYARAVADDGGIDKSASRKRRVLFKELDRIYRATELMKNELRRRGVDYEIVTSDEEHPNAAYKRFSRAWRAQAAAESSCYVVNAIFGRDSAEVRRAVAVCRWRFALNPIVAPSWILYRILGPALATLAKTNPPLARHVNRLIATPIVRASRGRWREAIPWVLYLGIWGWAPIALSLWLILH